jgi:hypothetical protein
VRAFLTGPLVRLFPVGLCLLAMQRTFLTETRVFGVVLQIVLALVAGPVPAPAPSAAPWRASPSG